jgi:hypothetical protein
MNFSAESSIFWPGLTGDAQIPDQRPDARQINTIFCTKTSSNKEFTGRPHLLLPVLKEAFFERPCYGSQKCLTFQTIFCKKKGFCLLDCISLIYTINIYRIAGGRDATDRFAMGRQVA